MSNTDTQFAKGNDGKPKGAKAKKTILKEQIGLSTWEQVGDWLLNDGLEKYKTELDKLDGKDYLFGHSTMMEYFKPKLNRTTLEGGENPLEVRYIELENGAKIPI